MARRRIDKRKILFLTGTRADFGKMKPLILAAQEAAEFDTRVFVTGMHMLSRYGSTLAEVQKARVKGIFTYINQLDATSSHMDLVLGNTINGLAHYVREFPPDMIVVHGDRVETLAGAIVGALNNILVAHVEGGELSGTIDGAIRHSVTKLAHLHFVANAEARRRLLQLGESPNAVFVVGSPDVDVMLSDALPTLREVKSRYAIPFERYHVFVYHPVTTEHRLIRRNIEVVVQALRESGESFVVIYPNNDAGSDVILAEIEALRGDAHFRLLPSMRFEYFLTLLRNARSIVGNSSAGIREAPVYGVPTINIGSRQEGRSRSTAIIDVPENAHAIVAALRALPASLKPALAFGRGRSAELFLRRLRSSGIWRASRQKAFRDLVVAKGGSARAMGGLAGQAPRGQKGHVAAQRTARARRAVRPETAT